MGVAHDALGHQFGMLHHIGGVADDAGDEDRAFRQLHILPHLPLMFVARVGALDHEGARLDLEDLVDDLAQRNIRRVRAGPAAPAHVIAHHVGGHAFQRMVDDLDHALEPGHIVPKALGRHHAVIGDGGAGVVELHHNARVRDGLVFGADGLREGEGAVLVGLVEFVPAVGDHAGDGGDRQEGVGEVLTLEGGLEIVDVELQLRLARIGDRPGADGFGVGVGGIARVHLGVEACEARAVGAGGEGVHAAEGATLEAAEAGERILRPADRLAELAIAGHIHARRLLLAHHLGHARREASLVGGLVIGLAGLAGADEGAQRLGADQAADMGGEDAISAALHAWASLF